MTCLQIFCLLPCYRALMELALHIYQLHLYIRTHTKTHTLSHKYTHTPAYTHTHTHTHTHYRRSEWEGNETSIEFSLSH